MTFPKQIVRTSIIISIRWFKVVLYLCDHELAKLWTLTTLSRPDTTLEWCDIVFAFECVDKILKRMTIQMIATQLYVSAVLLSVFI